MNFLKKHPSWLAALVLPALVLSPILLLAAANPQGKEKDAEYAKKGRAIYVQLCVSCHGPSGKGDGPASGALKKPPADLTNIAQKYNGFPGDKIMTWIDGEKASSAHGTREMPVWGRQFRRITGSQAEAMGEVYALTKYLESIQKK